MVESNSERIAKVGGRSGAAIAAGSRWRETCEAITNHRCNDFVRRTRDHAVGSRRDSADASIALVNDKEIAGCIESHCAGEIELGARSLAPVSTSQRPA